LPGTRGVAWQTGLSGAPPAEANRERVENRTPDIYRLKANVKRCFQP
jgi:hypothetical protein